MIHHSSFFSPLTMLSFTLLQLCCLDDEVGDWFHVAPRWNMTQIGSIYQFTNMISHLAHVVSACFHARKHQETVRLISLNLVSVTFNLCHIDVAMAYLSIDLPASRKRHLTRNLRPCRRKPSIQSYHCLPRTPVCERSCGHVCMNDCSRSSL